MKGVLQEEDAYDCLWGDFESDESIHLEEGGTFCKFLPFKGYINHANSTVIIPEEFI